MEVLYRKLLFRRPACEERWPPFGAIIFFPAVDCKPGKPLFAAAVSAALAV
jgi:hypothetical protein